MSNSTTDLYLQNVHEKRKHNCIIIVKYFFFILSSFVSLFIKRDKNQPTSTASVANTFSEFQSIGIMLHVWKTKYKINFHGMQSVSLNCPTYSSMKVYKIFFQMCSFQLIETVYQDFSKCIPKKYYLQKIFSRNILNTYKLSSELTSIKLFKFCSNTSLKTCYLQTRINEQFSLKSSFLSITYGSPYIKDKLVWKCKVSQSFIKCHCKFIWIFFVSSSFYHCGS